MNFKNLFIDYCKTKGFEINQNQIKTIETALTLDIMLKAIKYLGGPSNQVPAQLLPGIKNPNILVFSKVNSLIEGILLIKI